MTIRRSVSAGLVRAATALVLLGAACSSGSSSTGPAGDANIAGTWQFNWNSLQGVISGVAITCTSILNFAITQTGTTFSGVQALPNGNLTCNGGGQPLINATIGSETIVAGQVSGNNVSFRLGSVNGNHSGTVSGTSMTGTGTRNIPQTTGGTLILTGEWNAAKK